MRDQSASPALAICRMPSSIRNSVQRIAVFAFAMPLAALLLLLAVSSPRQARAQANPILHTSILRKSTMPPGTNLAPRQIPPRTSVNSDMTPKNTGSGIVFTCDPTIAAATCTYLNTTVASHYNDTFTNANANIYIKLGSTGLGESQYYFNFVTYDDYVTAHGNIENPSTIQTSSQSALTTYDSTPYSSDYIWIQPALAGALGILGDISGGALGILYDASSYCTDLGSAGCYNGIITVTNDPGVSLYYDNLGGSEPADAYDFYAVVEHETDEILGTSSCISTENGNVLGDNCLQAGVPSAVDLYRYSSSGNLVLDSSLSTTPGAYFSYNGGATDGAQGNGHSNKYYNTLANGDDYADFVASSPDCGTNQAIQDATGCPGEDQGLTILNDGGAEINILNTLGYSLSSASTAPALTSPTSSHIAGATTFTWSPGTGSSNFALWIGTSSNTKNFYTSGVMANTVTSRTVTIPADGAKLYVSLYYEVSGVWHYKEYTFTEATPPSLTSPTASTVAGATTFTWSAGAGSSNFALWIGTTADSKNIYTSGVLASSVTSRTVTIPANGAALHVSLYYEVNGVWSYKEYSYTEAKAPSLSGPSNSSPIGGSTTFTWNSGTGYSNVSLWVGTSWDTKNVYTSGVMAKTITSRTVNIPLNGATLYVSLYYEVNGVWSYTEYEYTEKTSAITPVVK